MFLFFVPEEVSHLAVAGIGIATFTASLKLLKRFLNVKTLRLIEEGVRH